MIRILIGAAAGILIGAIVGYIGKCRTGTCPLTSNPLYGALFLGLLGAFIGWASAKSQTPPEPQSYRDIRSIAAVQDFDQSISQPARPVVVDFYATWCAPCRRLSPTIGKLSQTYAGKVDFIKVDIDQAQDLSRRFDVVSIPRIQVFDKGMPLGKPIVGLQDESAYVAAIEEAIAKHNGRP